MPTLRAVAVLAGLALSGCGAADARKGARNMYDGPAARPPMGWNSFDCFGSAVTEDEVRANAGYLAAHLKAHGWEYVVVDYCWSHPSPGAVENPNQGDGFVPQLAMDANGRLLPAPERFPSATGGRGFRPLADWVHAQGLKFGIHVMRGIPRQAVAVKTPVLGTAATASDIAVASSPCTWLDHMYGVDVAKPEGQAYYDSLFRLYAEWGVDYVKVDDLTAGWPPVSHQAEIEAVRRAIDRCGRPMVFSLSPGPAPLAEAELLRANCDLWRTSGDFWDNWDALKQAFGLCREWAKSSGPGHWADADMIPFGRLSKRGPKGPERWTEFTRDERVTLMTLWCIARSPLMYGGNMPENDADTLSLLTNDEVLAVNRDSTGNRELFRRDNLIAWIADVPGSADKYLALFNVADGGSASLRLPFAELGLPAVCRVRDLWTHEDLAEWSQAWEAVIRPHGAVLVRITPVR